ncbi:hypothetical protein KIN20_032197 [Parelaphostrongylus tenuis]|uniref:EGF-like domain-containing protein n=1 Tax=Parelaphostrongylus tenuis TaxID=148309 RepID=A0AAD5R690_PARTN|nr:hypothetical protein KIN20_032197 [Parelaphostrongylus tenuis]
MDADCAGYPFAYCDRACRCIDGALNAGSSCISSALESSTTCPPGQTYIPEAGVCMTAQSPGEPCQYSQQCAAAESGAFCLRLRCECAHGMTPGNSGCTFISEQCHERGLVFIPEIGECREALSPGSRGCSHNLQCSSAFSEATCILQTCTCPSSFPEAVDGTCGKRCPAGQTYSGVAGQCLPTVQPGDQCLYTSQCHAVHHGMICERNICRCSNGLVFTGSMCARMCPAGYMANSRGACTLGCQDNQIEVHGVCLNQATPGQICQVNAQCTGGSTCQNEQCTCPKGMTPKGSTCVFMEAQPLDSCRNGEKCTKESICVNGTCTCPAGRQIIDGHCATPLTVDIGDGCIRVGVVCQGGSMCVAGICTCPPGTTPFQNRCVEERTAKPGESCARMEKCVDGSYCNPESRCDCVKETQMVIGSRCVERLRSHPGYPCSNGEICIGGSFCLDSTCSCPGDMMEVNKQCLQRDIVHPNGGCGNGEICGGGSNCDQLQKRCICKRSQQIINQQCVDSVVVPPGGLCSNIITRCGGGSRCTGNHCECPQGTFLLKEKCVPRGRIAPGAMCTTADICLGGSSCHNDVCQCTGGTVLIDGRCEQKKKDRGMKFTPKAILEWTNGHRHGRQSRQSREDGKNGSCAKETKKKMKSLTIITRFQVGHIIISLLATILTMLGCGVMPPGQASTRSFNVTGFTTLPVAMVYSSVADVRTRVSGIGISEAGARGFVERLVMQTLFGVLERQARSALLPDAVITAILGQLNIQISYKPMDCQMVIKPEDMRPTCASAATDERQPLPVGSVENQTYHRKTTDPMATTVILKELLKTLQMHERWLGDNTEQCKIFERLNSSSRLTSENDGEQKCIVVGNTVMAICTGTQNNGKCASTLDKTTRSPISANYMSIFGTLKI